MTAAAKRYYKDGVRVSIGGVPCRMAQKPGAAHKAMLKDGYHGFDKASLKSVRAAEGRYARECLEAMGAKLPKAPKATGGIVRGVWSWTAQKNEEKALAVWDAECVAAYLAALAKAGRPQVVTGVVDESEPMLDLEPVAAVEPVQADEPAIVAAEVVEAPEAVKLRKAYAAMTDAELRQRVVAAWGETNAEASLETRIGREESVRRYEAARNTQPEQPRSYKLPPAFIVDCEESGCDVGIYAKGHLQAFAEQIAELKGRAEYYVSRDGPDQCPPGLKGAARALLSALRRELAG